MVPKIYSGTLCGFEYATHRQVRVANLFSPFAVKVNNAKFNNVLNHQTVTCITFNNITKIIIIKKKHEVANIST